MFQGVEEGRDQTVSSHSYCLVGLMVKAFDSRAEDPGFESHLLQDFSSLSHTSDLKMGIQWLPCQVPGVTGSALGLVGLVSIYCDWVRQKV